MTPVNVALVGLGYWGPNLARTFATLDNTRLHAVCDLDRTRLQRIERQFPGLRTEVALEALLNDPKVEAVAIATPVATHYEMAVAVLEADRHVLVEKPLASTSDEARHLVSLADERNLTLMVGHVFLYNAAVQRVKEYIDGGELGDIYYINAQRLNLGRIRDDVNALWNFAPHDISIISHWLDAGPTGVSARGYSFIQPGIEDVVFMNLDYPGGVCANVHISWLDPLKVRRMTVVGSEKMLLYDDVSADAKIVIYDRGITKRMTRGTSLGRYETFGEFQLLTRAGDVLIPRIDFVEPLRNQCAHFAECIRTGATPLTDGRHALGVVEVLEAADRAMKAARADTAAVGS